MFRGACAHGKQRVDIGWMPSSVPLHPPYRGRVSDLNLEFAHLASLASQLTQGVLCPHFLHFGITQGHLGFT